MKLLSIVILSCNRYDLLGATINSLLAAITYPYWELIVYNHGGKIGEGWNYLLERINGDYVLYCEDDWFFPQKWDWAERAIRILEEHKDVGMVRLRMHNDGQTKEEFVEKIHNGYLIQCPISCFTFNPFIMKKEALLKLGIVDDKEGGSYAERVLRERYSELELKTAKLDNWHTGVCIHLGRGRSIVKDEMGRPLAIDRYDYLRKI